MHIVHIASRCSASMTELDILYFSSSHMRSPYLVQFIGAFIDEPSRECMVLMEDLSRGSLNDLLHVDKVPLDCMQKKRIVSVMTNQKKR